MEADITTMKQNLDTTMEGVKSLLRMLSPKDA